MKTRLFLLFFMGLTLALTGCGDNPKSTSTTNAKQQNVQPAAPAPVPPSPNAPPKPADKSTIWPFLSEDQPISNLAENMTAKNFLLIFDGSGSMLESQCSGASRKIDVAKKAVTAWSKSVPVDANLGLYAFHREGILTLPLATGNRDAFTQAVNRIQAGGSTPLSDAMNYAYNTFTEQGKSQLGYGEYTIVVVTDGIANSISQLKFVVDKILSQSPILIYSIGFCIGNQHSLNQPGRTIYKSADNPEQLRQGLQDILAESESFDENEFSN